MRILSILAIITATATPALAHRDFNEKAYAAEAYNSAQVEKAALFTFDASSNGKVAGRNSMVGRDR